MVISRELIVNLVKELKEKSLVIGFTNGCFDILHSGHCTYLRKAKQLCDVLILGLNSDSSVKRLKGENRPLNNESDRSIVIDSLKYIDYTVIFDEDTPLNLINSIIPDVLIKGGDYKIEDIVGAETVINNGGKVLTIDFVEGKSTTNIINKMAE